MVGTTFHQLWVVHAILQYLWNHVILAANNLIHPYDTAIALLMYRVNNTTHPFRSLPLGPVGTILEASRWFLSTSALTAGDNACSCCATISLLHNHSHSLCNIPLEHLLVDLHNECTNLLNIVIVGFSL